MKAHVQKLLQRYGVYHRLKASIVYDLYWRIADPQLVRNSHEELGFYRTILQGFRPRDLIFDVGANLGWKTRTFLRLGARVVAIEPDATNQRILEESFVKLRLASKPVTIVAAAVSADSGTEFLWIDQPGSAKNTLSTKWVDILRHDEARFGHTSQFDNRVAVQTTTLDALIAKYGRPFFVKIDVEGAEPQVLRGLTQRVPYVSFEVNLPEFVGEGLECVARLDQLAADGRFNYVVDYGRGLELPQWIAAADFAPLLRACHARSVEVFWSGMGYHRSAVDGAMHDERAASRGTVTAR